MRKIHHLALVGCSAVLFSQCATQDEVRELNYQLRAVNQKVEDVKSNTVNQMQKRQASSVSKIDQVESELLSMRSLVEENAHQTTLFREQTKEDLASMRAALEAMRTENEQRIQLMEQKLGQVTSGMDRMQQARIKEAEIRAREASRRAEEAKRRTVVAAAPAGSSGSVRVAPTAKKATLGSAAVVAEDQATPAAVQQPVAKQAAQASPSAPATSPVDAAMGKAMELYTAGNYKEAYRVFEQVLTDNPRGAKAAETLYYMGECLFNQGEYDLAILDYQKVISNHAKDALAPAALLKQGMSFEKLTDLETAKIIYKKLIADYAGSKEAGLAKDRLDSL